MAAEGSEIKMVPLYASFICRLGRDITIILRATLATQG